MTTKSFRTPILFLTFNRPDTTQAVFNEIRKAQPAQLFVATDAPRKDKPDDIEKCKKVLEIIQQVDWDCKLSIFSHEENVGGKIGITSAIDWFFSQVNEGIILEDDCVPDQSFFPFCQELLERYRDDERIMIISGNNFQFGKRRTDYSYYFSRYEHCWGYATWKRVWQLYDIKMKQWPLIRDGGWLNDILNDQNAVEYWTSIFEGTYRNEIYSYDYQLLFTCWVQGGLCINPNSNLVSNIGFGADATHTKDEGSVLANIPVFPMLFPLNHPPFIIRDDIADNFTEKKVFFIASDKKSLFKRIKHIMGHLLGKI